MNNQIIDTYKIVEDIKGKFKYLNISNRKFNGIIEKVLLETKKEFSGKSINEYKNILIKNLTNAMLEYEKMLSIQDCEVDSYLQYIKDISSLKVLTSVEIQNLFINYKKGNINAKTELILGNLTLVLESAKKFQGQGLELLDLVEEGNIGLIKAIDHYDMNRGCPFGTYALIWINQAMRRSIALKTRNIKIAMEPNVKMQKYIDIKEKLTMELGRECLPSDIAQKLNVSIKEITELELLQFDTISLNTEITLNEETEDEVTLLGDIIADKNDQIENLIMMESVTNEIDKLFDICNLSEREKEMLYYRFGLKDRKECVYEDLKGIFGISGERARQITEDALLKLRRSNYIKNLAIFMDYPEQAVLSLKKYQKVKKQKKKTL